MRAEHQHKRRATMPAPEAIPGRLPFGARQPLGISDIRIGARTLPIVQTDLLALPFGVLTEFSAPGDGRRRVLVIAPLAGGFPVLLRDLVIGLLRHADVALSDWFDARHVPASQGRFGLDENVAAVAAMIRHLGPGLDVVAVCQGVVPGLLASALIATEGLEATPRSLALIGGPVDPRAHPTRLVHSLQAHSLRWFQDHLMEAVQAGFAGQGRLVYPASLQLMTLMGYLSRHMMGAGELFWKTLYDDGEDPLRFPFLQLCLRLMDLPFELFSDTIRHVYQECFLCQGPVSLSDRQIELRALRRTALMSVEGERDDIVAPGQTRAVHDLCGCADRPGDAHMLVPGCGHFSLFHGAIWRQRVLPQILQFQHRSISIRSHQGKGARRPGAASLRRASR